MSLQSVVSPHPDVLLADLGAGDVMEGIEGGMRPQDIERRIERERTDRSSRDDTAENQKDRLAEIKAWRESLVIDYSTTICRNIDWLVAECTDRRERCIQLEAEVEALRKATQTVLLASRGRPSEQFNGALLALQEALWPSERESMADLYDVTVRIPVAFESAAEMAGWVNGAIEEAMAKQDWSGGCAVLYRREPNGPIVMFHQGLIDPYDGALPHGLASTGAERADPPEGPADD